MAAEVNNLERDAMKACALNGLSACALPAGAVHQM